MRRPYRGPRPNTPERQVVEEASCAAFAPLGPSAGTVSWKVNDRIIRPFSTIFVIDFISGREQSRAFYKNFHCPRENGKNSWKLELGAGLTRSVALTRTFNELSKAEGTMIAPVLSVEPSMVVSVTRAMPGRAVGQFRWPGLTRGRREGVLEIHRRIGQAIHLLERSSDIWGGIPNRETKELRRWVQPDSILTQAESVQGFTKRDLMRLRRNVEKLYAETLSAEDAFVYAHNDLSDGNILLDNQRLGLIDATFLPRYRGYDLAKYAFRLDYQNYSFNAWSDTLIDALLEGYGDANANEQAPWKIIRLLCLIQLLNRSSASKHKRLLRKAFKEIKAYM